MAGTNTGFDAQAYIDGITIAQTMGLPPLEADQPKFFSADTRVDSETGDTPWDYRDPAELTPDEPPPTGTAALCGVKVTEVSADETSAGQMTPIELELTFLPGEWAKVSDFATMTYCGLEYQRGRMLPKSGLFEVEMNTVHVRTRESS